MRISSGTIGMESNRSYTSTYLTMAQFTLTARQSQLQSQTSLNTQVKKEGNQTPQNQGKSGNTRNTRSQQVAEWKERLETGSVKVNIRNSADTLMELRQQCIRYIFELLFGKKAISPLKEWAEEEGFTFTASETENSQPESVQLGIAQNGQLAGMAQNGQIVGTGQTENGQADMQNAQSQPAMQQAASQVTITTNVRVLQYKQMSWHVETEDTTFSTQGKVYTADGREIPINVEVGMSRNFQEYYETNLEMGSVSMCDPLVINLSGDVADISDQKFYFDIDADGEKDEISRLGIESGYLALDHNEDGVINDGSELFGTDSGNGFADLAKYDEDGNGWIDESDAVWDKLQIWCHEEDGSEVLYRLADKGIGAICLQNTSTDFTLKNETNGQTKAAIRKTGIFLYENGSAGTIQHVDMTKFNQNA